MALLRWINRHPKAFLYTSGCIGIALLFFYLFWMDCASVWQWDVLLLFAVLCVSIVLLRRIAFSREALYCNRVWEACDPEPMLCYAHDMLLLWDKGKSKDHPTCLRFRTTELAALLFLGRVDEAAVALEALRERRPKLSPDDALVYQFYECNLLLMTRRTEEAAVILNTLRNEIATNLPKTSTEDWQETMAMAESSYRLQTEGASQELLEQASAYLNRCETRSFCARVGAQYHMAKILLALNRREEAMPYLDFVAQNGGKLWVRQWAVDAAKSIMEKNV